MAQLEGNRVIRGVDPIAQELVRPDPPMTSNLVIPSSGLLID